MLSRIDHPRGDRSPIRPPTGRHASARREPESATPRLRAIREPANETRQLTLRDRRWLAASAPTALIVCRVGIAGFSHSVQGSRRFGLLWLCRPFSVWLHNEWPAAGIPPWRGSKRDRPPDD